MDHCAPGPGWRRRWVVTSGLGRPCEAACRCAVVQARADSATNPHAATRQRRIASNTPNATTTPTAMIVVAIALSASTIHAVAQATRSWRDQPQVDHPQVGLAKLVAVDAFTSCRWFARRRMDCAERPADGLRR